MKKILFLTRGKGIIDLFWSEEARHGAAKHGFAVEVPAAAGDLEPDFDFTPMLADCNAIITSWGSPCCNRELLRNAPLVKVIGHSAGSVAAVVDESTFDCGVRVTSANPVMAEAVAEWSLMMTLIAARDFWKYAQFRGKAPLRWGNPDRDLRDLSKLTVGIWGMGDTTRHLLRMLAQLRVKRVVVASQHSSEEELAEYGAEKVTFEEVFAGSDIIHSLAGVTPETLFKVGAKELASIKDGATLINCGRATLFQEQALMEALEENRFTAILDVYWQEPLPENSRLRSLPNVILTPHNAGYTARGLYVPFILEQFALLFSGKPMSYEITRRRFLTQTNETLGGKK